MLLCSLASASIISVAGIDTNRGANIWLNADGVDARDYAGVIRVSIDSGSQLDAYCIDLFVGVSVGDTYPVYLSSPESAQRQRIAWLVQTQTPIINALPNGTEKQLRGAALQLTIWDIVHDNGDGFAAGRVRWDTSGTNNTNASVRTYSEDYRTMSIGQGVNNFGLIAMHTSGPDTKQMMFLAYSQAALGAMGITQDTPEPASFLLSGAALILLGGLRPKNRL